MIEQYELNELRLDPPTPHEIASMPQIDRDQLLALPSETLNTIFKGFLSGEHLKRIHKEKDWLPNPDLLDAMLFAGKGSFKGLQHFTYEQIDNLTVSLKNQNDYIETYPVPNKNIWRSLHIVERLVNGQFRRTGEPVAAHNYRCLLYMKKRIDYYNELHNSYNSNSKHTPEIAEIEYIATNLHDFDEDPIMQNDKSILVGKTRVIPNPDDTQNNQMLFLRRAMQSKRGETSILEDVQLDLDPKQIHYLQNALRALNSSTADKDMIIEHLMGIVYEEYASIKLFDTESFVLSSIPIYIKTGADRPDNLATYFSSQTVTNRHKPTSVEGLITKAQENVTMFNLAELHMLTDGPSLFSSSLVIPKDEEIESPSLLKFFPSRWSKLALLGLSPNQMYTTPEDGGLPELI